MEVWKKRKSSETTAEERKRIVELARNEGFVDLPVSFAQYWQAKSAREFLEGCKQFEKIREMMLEGRSTRDISIVVAEEWGSQPQLSRSTLFRYISLYRRYFVRPDDVVKRATGLARRQTAEGEQKKSSHERHLAKRRSKKSAAEAEPARAKKKKKDEGTKSLNLLKRKFEQLEKGLEELGILDDAIRLQWERVKEQREQERQLQFPMPNLWREVRELAGLVANAVNLKADLGIVVRVPQRLALEGNVDVRSLDVLTDEERAKLAEFGDELQKMIVEMVDVNGVYERERA